MGRIITGYEEFRGRSGVTTKRPIYGPSKKEQEKQRKQAEAAQRAEQQRRAGISSQISSLQSQVNQQRNQYNQQQAAFNAFRKQSEAAAKAQKEADESARARAANRHNSELNKASRTEDAYKQDALGGDASENIYAKESYINRGNNSSMQQYDFSSKEFGNNTNSETDTETNNPETTQTPEKETNTFKPTSYKTPTTPESEADAQAFLNDKKEKVKQKYGDYQGIGHEFNYNDFTNV